MAPKDMWEDDVEQLAQHPVVRRVVKLRNADDARKAREHWKKDEKTTCSSCNLSGDWSPVNPLYSEIDALKESARCWKCADAPCTASCPTSVDVKNFIYNMSKQNYYNAGKQIFSDNPLGLTCGTVCATSKLCGGSCNQASTRAGAIEIGPLQQYACDVFLKMGIAETRDPCTPLPPKADAPIALVGAGSASLSCATFLARLGYSKIVIYEKEKISGGILSTKVPQHRLPHDFVKGEIARVEKLGVKFEFGKELGKDFTLESLKSKDGFAAVFVGIGLPQAFSLPWMKDEAENLWDFSSFLTKVCVASKKLEDGAKLPKMEGHVVVLGGGDTAYNCASAALRCGASRVTLAFREDWLSLPACREEFEEGKADGVELMSNVVPVSLAKKDGTVSGVVLKKQYWTAKDSPLDEKETASIVLSCSAVIVAFGGVVGSNGEALLKPLTLNKIGSVDHCPDTMSCKDAEWVFVGGDLTRKSVSIVEAVNDGKIAAFGIHRLLGGGETPEFPLLHTPVDDVDVSVDICGMHFINPFGLSSATPTTSIPMIKRAFRNGWSYCATKTIMLDKDASSNVSPRIIKAPSYGLPGPNQVGFQNIELLTEKGTEYWVQGIRKLKEEFPKHIVIASIMASNKEDWEELAKRIADAKPDGLELNLSCPHTGKKGFGMLAGQDPTLMKEITQWVRAAVGDEVRLFVKLTPNITDIAQLAQAAMDGGATGISAINTVSGLTSVQPSGIPWPNVGEENGTAYGGVSGNIIRPIALRAISQIRKRLPKVPILGIGGIDSAESAMQMIHCGADVIQITSSIQNQEYSIVDEMISGLKFYLYAKKNPCKFANWYGQSPAPDADYSLVTPCDTCPKEINKLVDERDVTVPHISVVPSLELSHQVFANVQMDDCVKCGRCYMACNDTGYQAIDFDPVTHKPFIREEKCMGCGLCLSVCPAACIEYKRKTVPHKPDRGIRKPGIVYPFDG